jgi:hypothetical protein
VSETVLEGGDVNVVVRVGDTVRRPTGEWSPAVHALLRHYEAVGFDGALRFVGIDDLFPANVILREGMPEDRRPERVRLLCDSYGLSAQDRARFFEKAVAIRRSGYGLHERLGGEERRPGWREMWDAGSGEAILGNLRLLEQLRPELEAALA